MYLKKSRRTNGKTQLSVMQDCWDNKARRVRHYTIETLGNLEDLIKTHPDVDTWADAQVKRCEEEFKFPLYKVDICIHPAQRIDRNTSNQKNIGSIIPLSVYAALGIDTNIKNFTHKHKIPLNVSAVLKLLVIDRVCNHYSLCPIWENKELYFIQSMFQEQDISHALDTLVETKEHLCMHINRVMQECKWFDFSSIYFSIINFYYETPLNSYDIDGITNNKATKCRGVKMALLSDAHGLPFVYRRFSGDTHNESDLQSALNEMLVSEEVSKLYLFPHSQSEISIRWLMRETHQHIDCLTPAYKEENWSDAHVEAYFLASYIDRIILKALSLISTLPCSCIIHELTTMTSVCVENKWWILSHRTADSDTLLESVGFADLKHKYLSTAHIKHLCQQASKMKFFNPNTPTD